MSSKKKSRGWIALGSCALLLVAARLANEYAVFCWGWVLLSLMLGWFALTRLRPGFIQALIVGGALLNAAAGVANGLVMTANGGRMPVETVNDWSRVPSFLEGKDFVTRGVCGLLVETDETLKPGSDDDMHVDVPLPHVVHPEGQRPPIRQKPPAFAVLDDREGIRVCGAAVVYSKGDLMGFLGSSLWALGVTLLIFRTFWRGLRRPKAPAG